MCAPCLKDDQPDRPEQKGKQKRTESKTIEAKMNYDNMSTHHDNIESGTLHSPSEQATESDNKQDLLKLLTVEKGSVAGMIIETIDLTDPPEIMYKEEHIREL